MTRDENYYDHELNIFTTIAENYYYGYILRIIITRFENGYYYAHKLNIFIT